MMHAKFQSWLERKFPPGAGTAVTRLNNCKRVEDAHGDLDMHYNNDQMAWLCKRLKYSMVDKRAGRPNPSNISLENCDLYNNLAMYRSAIKLYREFRQTDAITPTLEIMRPRHPVISVTSWPEWEPPSNQDLLHLAKITVPYVRFLHTDIVLALVEDNEYRRESWGKRLAEQGVNPSLYLWERSACAFPGVRRYMGSTEIARHRRRVEVTARPQNALAIDDNDYPKHIWSYVFRGKRFQKQGPPGYALAHLMDHKEYKNRIREEFVVDHKIAPLSALFGLFTSVTNTVYMPSGLVRPTDFSFLLRNLIQRKAFEIYGKFCNLLPTHLSLRPAVSDAWSLDAFQWREPVGTLAHVPAFLRYRNEEIERLLSQDFEAANSGRSFTAASERI
jgi:hypothetical protein